MFPVYGSTARMLAVKLASVDIPAYFSTTPAPLAPALPGKLTVKVPDPPAAIVPQVCGNGDPVAVPSVAVVRVTLDAGPAPELWSVMVNV